MVDPSPSQPSPPRGWRRLIPRFRVRSLILIILAVGGPLGWWANAALVQRRAVAAITAAGGEVHYDWGWDPEYSIPLAPSRARPPGPGWLVERLGVDFVASVASVRLVGGQGDKATDALMEQVGRLTRLQRLDLNGCGAVTNAGVAHLRHLDRMRDLDLRGTGADGDALRHVAGMTSLRKLELPSRPVSDADLARLANLTGLEWLQGHSCRKVTDAGLMHLRGLTRLKTLALVPAPITSKGLTALRDMTQLESLYLPFSAVADLAPVGHLAGLARLNLTGAPIDDAGLAPIATMTRMESVTLSKTRVTDAGLEHLRGLKNIDTLAISHLAVGDAGMAAVGTLTNLVNLYLDRTAVGDAGLARLSGLNKLDALWAVDTRVTDAGLIGLRGMNRCNKVLVNGPGITDAGIASARQNRPGCDIRRRVEPGGF